MRNRLVLFYKAIEGFLILEPHHLDAIKIISNLNLERTSKGRSQVLLLILGALPDKDTCRVSWGAGLKGHS